MAVVHRLQSGRRSVLLGYHGLGPVDPVADPHGLRIPVERFLRQVEALRRAGFELVTMRELTARAAGGPPPPGLAVLTFDDAMADNHELLLPLVRREGLPVTIYVPTGLLGQPNPFTAPGSGLQIMTESQLREVAAAGAELGAHTVTHADLAALDEEGCLAEMLESRAWLEAFTGGPVESFAYPFGRFGEPAVRAARRAGFATAVTVTDRGPWDPMRARRQMVSPYLGTAGFALAMAGAYDAIREHSVTRAGRAASRPLRAVARRRRLEG